MKSKVLIYNPENHIKNSLNSKYDQHHCKNIESIKKFWNSQIYKIVIIDITYLDLFEIHQLKIPYRRLILYVENINLDIMSIFQKVQFSDFLTKESLSSLDLKITALVKSLSQEKLYLYNSRLVFNEKSIRLNARECELIKLLDSNNYKSISYLNRSTEKKFSKECVRVYINRINQKTKKALGYSIIKNQYGVGYSLKFNLQIDQL